MNSANMKGRGGIDSIFFSLDTHVLHDHQLQAWLRADYQPALGYSRHIVTIKEKMEAKYNLRLHFTIEK